MPLRGISVDGVIGLAKPLKVLVFVNRFFLPRRAACFDFAHIKNRIADDVLLAGPVAEIEEAAAFAAEGEFRVGVGIGGFTADGANVSHATKNTAKCGAT